MNDPTEDLRAAARRLQTAQLAGGTDVLDQQLDDRPTFTLGPNLSPSEGFGSS